MNIPGNIYKTDKGLCFVPDENLSFFEVMSIVQMKMTVCSEESIEDDWQHVETVNKTKYSQTGFNINMLDEGINTQDD